MAGNSCISCIKSCLIGFSCNGGVSSSFIIGNNLRKCRNNAFKVVYLFLCLISGSLSSGSISKSLRSIGLGSICGSLSSSGISNTLLTLSSSTLNSAINSSYCGIDFRLCINVIAISFLSNLSISGFKRSIYIGCFSILAKISLSSTDLFKTTTTYLAISYSTANINIFNIFISI